MSYWAFQKLPSVLVLLLYFSLMFRIITYEKSNLSLSTLLQWNKTSHLSIFRHALSAMLKYCYYLFVLWKQECWKTSLYEDLCHYTVLQKREFTDRDNHVEIHCSSMSRRPKSLVAMFVSFWYHNNYQTLVTPFIWLKRKLRPNADSS